MSHRDPQRATMYKQNASSGGISCVGGHQYQGVELEASMT